MRHKIYLWGIILISILFLVPILLLIVSAFLPSGTAMRIARGMTALSWQSVSFSFDQMCLFLSDGQNHFSSLLTSFAWCFLVSAVQIAFSVLTGFILAKYRLRVMALLTLVFTLATVIPLQMYLIPTYRFLDAYSFFPPSLALYVPLAFAPFGAVFMRQVCLQLPEEYVESYRMESQSFTKLMRYVVFPFCQSYGIVLFLFSLIESWG